MTPGKVNLVIYQGATFSKEFVWQLGGVPVDIDDSFVVMDIRENIDSETPPLHSQMLSFVCFS